MEPEEALRLLTELRIPRVETDRDIESAIRDIEAKINDIVRVLRGQYE